MEKCEFLLQLDRVRRLRKPAIEHRDGLLKPSSSCKLSGMFDEGRRKWRPPGGHLPYLLQRLLLKSRFGERRRKQGFDNRVFAAPRGSFQRRDRLGGPVLHQQRLTKYLRCSQVP